MKKRKDWVEEGPKQAVLRNIRTKKHKQYNERLGHSDLAELVKEYSGYHKYEVEDILYYTAIAIAEIIASGRAVQFRGVGFISPRIRKSYTFPNAFLDGAISTTNPKRSISLKADHYMLNMLNLPEETLDLIINDKLKKEKKDA